MVLDSVTSTPQWIRQPWKRVYLKEGTYHTRLFRGPSTNDMKSRMVLAAPGPLLTPPPSSPPPKTPHRSYSAQIQSQNENPCPPDSARKRGSTLTGAYNIGLIFVSARTNKRHHHHHQASISLLTRTLPLAPVVGTACTGRMRTAYMLTWQSADCRLI